MYPSMITNDRSTRKRSVMISPRFGSSLLRGLAGWWEFEVLPTATQDAIDSHIYHLDLSANPSTTLEQTPGMIGNAISSTGSALNDLEYSGLETSKLMPGQNGFAVSLWFWPNTNTYRGLASRFGSGADGRVFNLVQRTFGGPNLRVTATVYINNAGGSVVIQSGDVLPVDQWHHVILNVDLNIETAELWVNGELVDSDNVVTIADSTNHTFRLGGQTDGDFSGKLDQAAFYDRPLTSDELGEIYNNGNGISYISL